MERKTDPHIQQNVMKRKRSDATEETVHSDAKHMRTDDGVTNHAASYYEKREGTSGFGGLLYATKLQTLVLLRALNHKTIERFLLGSIVHHIGAFDDLVLKFHERGQTKPKLLLVHTKHKDDPKKHNITIGEVNNKGGDINIKKRFQSFLQIKSNFRTASDNTFLETSLDEMDHEFIIYTNAENDLSEEEVDISTTIDEDDMLYSGQEGKIIRFKSHYMESLLCTLMEWRIARLAESFANFVLSDDNSYSDMMSDEFIKCYHPFLARHVLQVSTEIFEDESNETIYYRESKFIAEFLDTDDDTMSTLRETLYKKIATHKFKSVLSLNEISNVINKVTLSQKTVNKLKATKKEMKMDQFKNELKKMQESQATITEAVNAAIRNKVESLLIKVPSTFGNLDCAIISQTQLEDISTKIAKLFKNPKFRNDNVIKIDRNSIGTDKVLNDKDIEVIGTFVGNLLVLEEKTQMFMFNANENSLLKHAKQFLGVLKTKSGILINDFKFQIDAYDFPRLSLYNRYTDDNIVLHFLNTFKIYTNQANETGVEELLIKEIGKYYNDDNKNKKRLCIKSRAMFLKVHDDIQKWWKLKEKRVPCLDENCKFFEQAKSDTSPLLTILNVMYTDKFNKNIEFEDDSIKILKLYDFMTISDERLLHIFSEHHVLTAIKLNQYFNINNRDKYRFLDLDYAIKKRYYSDVCDELNNATLDVVIIKYQEQTLQEEFLDDLMEDITVKKMIFISDNIWSEKNAFIKDERNNLVNLTVQSQGNMLKSIIIYQGEETRLSTIIDDETKCLVNSEILNKLVNNETITIGKTLTNAHYESIRSYYINRQLNRFIKINKKFINCDGKINEENTKELHIVYGDEQIDQLNNTEDYDVLLISNEEQYFNKLCEQYPSLYIHWFKKDNKNLVWEKSRGRLKRIFKYVDEDDFEDYFADGGFVNGVEFSKEDLEQLDDGKDKYMPEPKVITDIKDKIVIISGEPGMGKSNLLTHLSIEKKKRDTSAWIVKMNLVDLSSEFRNWRDSEIKYDQVVRFLYKAIDFQAFNENNDQSKKYKEKIIENILTTVAVSDTNEIILNKQERRLQGSDLFEIQVFNSLHNKGRYIILLDGFDEIIPDYKKEVIDLLKILKQSKAERLWVTTRSYNVVTELEDNLHTFSYTLEPFSSDDQMKFLEKFWTVHLELDEMKDKFPLKAFYRVMMTFYDSFTDQDIPFTSIPMHIYMISRIFKDIFKEYYEGNIKNCTDFLNENINNFGVYLYEQYIDIKVREIFFEKKIHFKNMDDPSMKDIVEDKMQKIIKTHKLLATHTIFNAVYKSGLFSKDEENQIQMLIKNIESGKEKMGFVDRVVNGQARFVHTTFAEYFAALFICDVVKCNSNPDFVWEFLIETVFKKIYNVRIFFDRIIACDSELNDFMSNTDHKGIIFNLLIKQGKDPLNSTTALSHASIENLEKILTVLMNSLEGNVNEDNLDDFIQLVRKGDFLANAIEAQRKDLAVNIFRIVKEIDRSKLIDIVHYMDEYSKSSSLIGALRSFDNEMLNIVLGDMTEVELVSIFKIKDPSWSNRTLLHQLFGEFKLKQLELYLVKLNMEQLMDIANVKDDFERTSAHYAGKHLDLYFLQFFQKHLQDDYLRTLCLSMDVNGKTVMDYLEQKTENMSEQEIDWYTHFKMAMI